MNKFKIGDRVSASIDRNTFLYPLNGIMGTITHVITDVFREDDHLYNVEFDKEVNLFDYNLDLGDYFTKEFVFFENELKIYDPDYNKKIEMAKLEHIVEDPYGEENWI